MKKFAVFLLISFIMFTVFASKQLFTQDCEEVQVLYRLFREGGVSIPSFVFPVSGDVLLQTIEYTDLEQELSHEALAELENLKSVFVGENTLHRFNDNFAFNADVSLSAMGMFPTTEEKNVCDDYFVYKNGYEPLYQFNEIPAFFKAETDLFITDYAVGHFEYEYSKRFDEYRDEKLQFNVLFDSTCNSTVPYNTYLNIGTKKIDFFAGRVRNSSGTGITGNLAVGDNFLFRNTVKLQLNALPFSYELVVNRFDSENLDKGLHGEYSGYNDTKPSNFTHLSKLDAEAPVVVMHKVNFLLSKKLNIGIYEALMDYSRATIADPKLLGPFNLMHNFLSYQHDTNNFFGFDVDWAVNKGLSLHSEFIFDQIQLSDEKHKKVPGAYGTLFNCKYTKKISKGYLSFYGEAVYTNPWLYLKPADYKATDDSYYTLDLIVGNFHMNDAKTDISYLGYKYGPDSVVGSLGSVWDYNRNRFSFDFLAKLNGNVGLRRLTDQTARGKDEYVNAKSPYILGEGTVQQLYQFTFADKFNVFENRCLQLTAALSVQFYRNFNCESGNNVENVIFACGAVFHPMKIWKNK